MDSLKNALISLNVVIIISLKMFVKICPPNLYNLVKIIMGSNFSVKMTLKIIVNIRKNSKFVLQNLNLLVQMILIVRSVMDSQKSVCLQMDVLLIL